MFFSFDRDPSRIVFVFFTSKPPASQNKQTNKQTTEFFFYEDGEPSQLLKNTVRTKNVSLTG